MYTTVPKPMRDRNLPPYFKTRCCNVAQLKQEGCYSFRPLKLQEERVLFQTKNFDLFHLLCVSFRSYLSVL